MAYELYTVPKCGGCEEVKNILNEKEIPYETYNLRDPEHKKVFGKVYTQIDGDLKRNVTDNKTILPILVEVDESRTVKRFGQRPTDISDMFN
jgi:glutaredoxin